MQGGADNRRVQTPVYYGGARRVASVAGTGVCRWWDGVLGGSQGVVLPLEGMQEPTSQCTLRPSVALSVPRGAQQPRRRPDIDIAGSPRDSDTDTHRTSTP
eukprot:ctg_4205.g497